MGLSLFVGLLADDKQQEPALFKESKEMFERVSRALLQSGQKPHVEPEDIPEGRIFSCQMFGYSGLHHLRQFAAHIQFGKPLYNPARELPKERHPLVADYYRLSDPSRENPLPFEHLMQHSDCEGFYVPQDFKAVVVDKDLGIPGKVIGSSVQLLGECLHLARELELPIEINLEDEALWQAADEPGKSPVKWQRYGVESFSCLRLIRACEASIGTGAALVFC